MRFFQSLFTILALTFFGIVPALYGGEPPPTIKIDVQEFFLNNGMQFLVVPRTTTPQVACRIAIRTGSALEPEGQTGIAHMLEHMMFKGTKNFGTRDVDMDRALQEEIEAAYQVILAEKKKRLPDTELIKTKQAQMAALRRQVQAIYIPQAFSSQLGRNGAVGVNAFTSKDQTQYTMSIPADMLEQWFSIISEQLFEPSWREFYVEKEVVQREWAFRYINDPNGSAWLDLNAAAYSAHPYGHPTIGWKGDMERFNTRDAVAFHKKHYNATNAVCVLVGDVNVDDAKRLAKIYFERYPSGVRSPEAVTREPPRQGARKSIRYLKGARTPLVRIGFHGARMGTRDFYALDALTMVLSHGRSARLTEDIINKGHAASAWAYNPDNRYGGLLILGGTPNEPRGLDGVSLDDPARRRAYEDACAGLETLLLSQVEKMQTTLVSQEELRRIKKLNQRDFLDRMRSNENLATTLATLETQTGWRYLTTYLEHMDTITPRDIQRVARAYLKSENKTSVYVIPGGTPDKPPQHYTEVRSLGGSSSVDMADHGSLENHSIYPTPRGWKHPLSFDRRPQKIIYPPADVEFVQATPVFFMPDTELPMVQLLIRIKAGNVDIHPSKAGLGHLLNVGLEKGGSTSLSPEALARRLDDDAISLSIAVGEEQTSINLSMMENDWETAVDILKDILTRPRFDPQVIHVARQKAITALHRQAEDAQKVAQREWHIWHFAGHPYGRNPLQAISSMPHITRDDLLDFIRRYFVPANMVVAVSGDIEKQRALRNITQLIHALPDTEPPKRDMQAPPETPPVLTLIHKPGQVQSQVVLGLHGVPRSHPDYWKANLLMSLFGGDDSLMYKRLRDDLGLVYSAGFYQSYKWKAGFLAGYIGCRGDKTGEAVLETVKIMKKMHKAIPVGAFERKKLDILNSFVFNVDTPAALVEVYAGYQIRDEPLNTLERIQEDFMRATAEDMGRLARTLLSPERIQIFVVGDKSIRVGADAAGLTLQQHLVALADQLGIPFQEIELR